MSHFSRNEKDPYFLQFLNGLNNLLIELVLATTCQNVDTKGYSSFEEVAILDNLKELASVYIAEVLSVPRIMIGWLLWQELQSDVML